MNTNKPNDLQYCETDSDLRPIGQACKRSTVTVFITLSTDVLAIHIFCRSLRGIHPANAEGEWSTLILKNNPRNLS